MSTNSTEVDFALHRFGGVREIRTSEALGINLVDLLPLLQITGHGPKLELLYTVVELVMIY